MNPFYVYGIGLKAFNNKVIFNSEFNNIIDLCKYLRQNPNGTDVIKQKVNDFINTQPEHHKEWCKRIILKNLRIGITESTVNKVYGKFIPVFEVMLAKPFERMFEEIVVEYKIDGVRVIAVKQNGITHLFTRNGKRIEGYNFIESDLNQMSVDNIVFDGEIISGDYTGTMNNLFAQKNGKVGIYNIFDIIDIEDFSNGKSKEVYYERLSRLNEESFKYGISTNKVNSLRFMDGTIVHYPTVEKLSELTDNAVKQGYEGIMIKDVNGFYECKRGFGWQKMKPFFSDEYPIIGFESGTGKYKNILGKVIVDVDGVAVGVGSGFTDAQRMDIWNNQKQYLGRIIEVQYQEKIQKTGSLRFPTIKGFREF
jgi:DNA ligase-1